MHGTSRAPNDRFENFSFMTDVAIDKRTPLGCPAIAKQARGHASEAALPLGDDWPPRGAGAARPRHKHDGWPLAALVVVNISAPVFDHDVFDARYGFDHIAGSYSRMAEQPL